MRLSGLLALILMLIYSVLFVGVNWGSWSPGWLIPPWFVAIGIYIWHEPIDNWGRRML